MAPSKSSAAGGKPVGHALIVDDDPQDLHKLAELVEGEDYRVSTAKDLKTARKRALQIGSHGPDVVITKLDLPDGDGMDLLKDLEDTSPVEVILTVPNATLETAVEALRQGAYDYLPRPIDRGRLKTILAQLSRARELRREVSSLRGELRKLGRFGPMVGTSEAMQRVYDLVERVAPTDASVFIIGESGTGKELVAHTVHQLSRRRDHTFLPLNCGAISPNLIESELFGHEKGAFTGADQQHKGFFERAHQGTIFLDEITEMPLELQVKLLRVLETGRIRRVGGVEQVAVDVRILAATNRDPEVAVRENLLREDLYYRLKVFPITLQPLRRRRGDVALLAEHFLAELNENLETPKRFTAEALEQLELNPWHGNVRELKNVVQRAHILADREISLEILPLPGGGPPRSRSRGKAVQVDVGASIADAERRLIFATLEEYGQDKKKAADVLGISRKTLYNRLKSYEEEEE